MNGLLIALVLDSMYVWPTPPPETPSLDVVLPSQRHVALLRAYRPETWGDGAGKPLSTKKLGLMLSEYPDAKAKRIAGHMGRFRSQMLKLLDEIPPDDAAAWLPADQHSPRRSDPPSDIASVSLDDIDAYAALAALGDALVMLGGQMRRLSAQLDGIERDRRSPRHASAEEPAPLPLHRDHDDDENEGDVDSDDDLGDGSKACHCLRLPTVALYSHG